MDAFIYQADIYCYDCGRDIRKRLKKLGQAPANPKDEHTYDSDEYPKGPYEKGGGEADTPQHCASGEHCINALELSDGHRAGCWLENPLTSDGAKYVLEHLEEDPNNEVVKLWAEWYSEEIDHAAKTLVDTPIIVEGD